MKILVTGGAGFIGSNLAIRLKAKWPAATIVAMDNLYRRGSELNVPRLCEARVEFVKGDVRQRDSFPDGPFDFIIECSAEPSAFAGVDGSPDYLFQTNLVGAYECLEKARQWNSGFLFLSTSRVYPIAKLEARPWREEQTRFVWPDDRGVTEDLPMSGARSLYGFTKYSAEQLIEEYRNAFGLRALVNRCGVIAGPWQFGKVDQGVAALWVLAHHFNRPLNYIGYGGIGKQVRDFLHVDDLCTLIIEQLDSFNSWNGWVGNVSGGLDNSASLCELTTTCEEIVGRKLSINSIPETRAGDLRIYIGNCTKLFQRTNWRPQKSVRDILSDIASWVRTHEKELAKLS